MAARSPNMLKRAILGYLAAELLAVLGLIWAFGIGWTLVIVAGVFLAGVLLAGSQLRTQLAALRRAGGDPRGALTDGALVGLGALLVFLPGVLSTAAGSLMLAPPTRGAMRPMAAALLSRGVARRIAVVTPPGRVRYGGDYIEGEVLDSDVIGGTGVGSAPNLPARR